MKELLRKLQAGAELTEEKKKNDNGFIIVTHTSVMFKVQLPVCRPDQEKTVPVQKHLHSLRLLFNHTSSVHSDHFAHV